MKVARTYTLGARADGVLATRERIVAVAGDLFLEQTFEEVTLAGIARASGVSHQTVLNHFRSKEGVVLAVAEAFAAATMTARTQSRPGDIAGAVRDLVGEYERIGDANVRWAMTSDRLPTLAPFMDEARAGHQRWIQQMFGAGLPSSTAARRRAVNALHAATDVYTWKLLRRDLGLSRSETEKTIVHSVERLLDPTDNHQEPSS